MKDVPAGEGVPIDGEQFVTTAMLGMIAVRYPAGEPRRAELEAWVKADFARVFKEGVRSGDVTGAVKKYTKDLQALLSQKEAELQLAERATGIEANKNAIKQALSAGDFKKAAVEKAFFALEWDYARDLKHPDLQRLLQQVSQTNDRRLLIRLARALEAPPKTGPEHIEVDRFQFFLVRWWAKGPADTPGLCRLTDAALTEVCNLSLDRTDLTTDKVRKTRQRLGLKKGRKPWFTKVTKTKRGIIVSVV